MFKKLREKLKNAISRKTKEIEEETKVTDEDTREEIEVDAKEIPEDIDENDEAKPEIKEVEQSQDDKESEEKPEVKKGFFSKVKDKITSFELQEETFEDLFWELELVLLENNMAVEVIDAIKDDLKNQLVGKRISRTNPVKHIMESLEKSLDRVLQDETKDIESLVEEKKPYVIMFIGVNGSGKTTTLAKVASRLQEQNKKIVMAACDTFRAAAIDQLEEHANKLGIKLIKHEYKSDPAAVAFDAIKHAKSKDFDVVLIDTAGRLHTNDNLMQELKKIKKVNTPDLKLFVGESITGNDCVEQAKIFNEKIGIDGIVLTKADIDDKGGAALSVSYITKKPIYYLGVGQEYSDLKPFDKKEILDSIFLD